jgi:putative nucleotidyltransferase with HDIG domain
MKSTARSGGATRFRDLSWGLRLLIVATAMAGGALFAALAARHVWGSPTVLAPLLLLGAGLTAWKVELVVPRGRITLGYLAVYLAQLMLGTPAAMLVAGVGGLSGTYLNRREGGGPPRLKRVPLFRAVFNVGNCLLAGGLMGLAHGAVFDGLDGSLPERLLPAMLAGTITYFLVNTLGMAMALGLSQRVPVLRVWRENCLWAFPGYLTCASVAVAAALVVRVLGLWSWLLVPPIYVVVSSYHLRVERARREIEHVQELNRLNGAILESLAIAIDAKDRVTCHHIHRVQEFALALAEELGVTEDEREAIRVAAVVHDIGKLGVPDGILRKPGKLSPEEYRVIQAHVEIGAAILEPVGFPWPVVPIVLAHHERWDGLGYPAALQGEAIPRGGRILSIADVFDALTSDRPYRQALAYEEALAVLARGRGTQFDPQAVDAFVRALPRALAGIRDAEVGAAGGQAGAPIAPPRPSVAVALARREAEAAAAAFEAAWAGSPGAVPHDLLCRQALELIPGTAAVVYLPQGSELIAAAVAGLGAERLAGMRIQRGEGASGWVADHGVPLANASAALDVARRTAPNETLELSSLLSVPLLTPEGIGALTVYHTSYQLFTEAHERLLAGLARAAGAVRAEGGAGDAPWAVPQSVPRLETT